MISMVAKENIMVAIVHVMANVLARNSCLRSKGLQTFLAQKVQVVEAPPANPIKRHNADAVEANNTANAEVIFAWLVALHISWL